MGEEAAAKANEEKAAKGEEGKAKEFNAEESFKDLTEKLDKIAAGLEAKGKKEESFDPEALLKELQREERAAPKGKEEGQKVEDMTAQQFAEFVLDTVHTRLVSPLEAKVEGLRVRAEVAECKAKYDDFLEYRDDIFKLAMKKPELSLEEAYLQVTGQSTVKSKREAKEKEAKEKAEKEKTEGERKERRGSFLGEKGGVSREASKLSPDTMQDAAVLALKDVLGQEK